MPLHAIPCTLMRGGTSKGPYFRMSDLPADPAVRDRVLLAAMGSPDVRQIDGLGGGDTLTSKVAMVGPSSQPGADVDYLFAQVSVDQAIVDIAPSCGNMLAGIGPFAIESGMVPAEPGETRVLIFNVNTNSRIEAIVRTPGGEVEYEGDAAIDGVPGTAAPILLSFMDVVGSKTGALLPTGRARDVIEGVEVTCIDVAMPMVIMRADDLGRTGYEGRAEMDSDVEFFARIEGIRRIAGERMGLGDVADKVIPKVGLLAPPRHGGSVTSRYFVPHRLHAAHAVTGAVCVASCCALEDSVAAGTARMEHSGREQVRIEHPSGKIDVVLETEGQGPEMRVVRAGIVRTARKLMAGEVYVPARLWEDPP
ncbi:MAG TPA: 4-oxalomesaconate tautomerase [Geminicoccaceae bacterium]|nr:4-oxalomesaconate tautomerase [Geminicoccaceae bacterium]